MCHQIFCGWRPWLELCPTWVDKCPWTLVLPPFYRLCSELIYISKARVHHSTTPADQSISCYSLSSTKASFNGAQGGTFWEIPTQQKPHVEIPSRGCDADLKAKAEIRGSDRNRDSDSEAEKFCVNLPWSRIRIQIKV